MTRRSGVFQNNVLDGEVNEIDSVVDCEGDGGGVVVCEDGGNSDKESGEVCFEVAFLVDDLAHPPLTMHRGAR